MNPHLAMAIARARQDDLRRAAAVADRGILATRQPNAGGRGRESRSLLFAVARALHLTARAPHRRHRGPAVANGGQEPAARSALVDGGCERKGGYPHPKGLDPVAQRSTSDAAFTD